MSHLDVSDLHKAYGHVKVLKGISFSVEHGEVVSVLGPSGSGKSTMLRCLNGLEEYQTGTIAIDGRPIGPLPESKSGRSQRHALIDQRRHFGMVFQHFELFPHLSVLDNVAVGQQVVLGRSRDEAVERARLELDRVGLAHLESVPPTSLSGGQAQRVGIARAVAMDPEILLFDEPTSALDPELIGEVLAVMRDLAHSHVTMIVVTHEIRFARDVADTMLFMDGGVVVESGPPNQLISEPTHERTRQFLRRLTEEGTIV
ncbi:MAG: amino acid ABC transporter ATP-binding protein [Bifidobacterium tibiigranuli]|jgi:ABC-type polar amino acid transport system ATPase subunit|uniref:amino acid ABC transporter ATP-binding protein n=1 Tax=Bifidobacterium tibiigranuli TaxID=2172043 RepID=UPI0026EB4B82|nr:amino acid ABC transporter ATP-binding protein [Bifidobacterium tibiigranuli]MCI1673702.1 amino acid ABC transporter ATP-binding protein [Bifidobacterium tibiigranuli]MCI1712958.1 amino acid ABC transporter ATP-binding protein [Bifidobacterium tibiigranuli]MCI1833535.1 amino acid ABC transporter ATP-binding protein [Bifidobacterium tibiigranuli]